MHWWDHDPIAQPYVPYRQGCEQHRSGHVISSLGSDDIDQAVCRKPGKSRHPYTPVPIRHAILGWREAAGRDTRRVNNSRHRHWGNATMNEAIRPTRNVELGASSEPFQNLHEFVRKARANLDQNAWDYIVGAAETE